MAPTHRLLLRLVSAQLCLHACMAGMRMAAPLLALSQGYSPVAVGVLLALFALTQVFIALSAGRYADRHGLKRPLAGCVAVASAGAALAMVLPVFPVLCASALMTGGATGAAVIALQRHVGRTAQSPTELREMFSWLAIGPAISNFLGPFSAGLLIDHAGLWLAGQTAHESGYRVAFGFLAGLPLLTWLLVRRLIELPTQREDVDARDRRVWDLLRVPMMRRLLLVNWLLSSCWDVHTFAVPVLGHERGLSASVIGSLLGAFAIAAAVVRLALPLLASRVREWVIITAAMAATAVLFSLYPLMTTPWSLGVCSVLLGLALGSVQPMVMSTLHQLTPAHRHGEALGLRLMTINASSVLMPMVFGTVGAVVGVSVVFWTVAMIVGLGGRGAWSLRPAGHAQAGKMPG